jgi:hypothetical protein
MLLAIKIGDILVVVGDGGGLIILQIEKDSLGTGVQKAEERKMERNGEGSRHIGW